MSVLRKGSEGLGKEEGESHRKVLHVNVWGDARRISGFIYKENRRVLIEVWQMMHAHLFSRHRTVLWTVLPRAREARAAEGAPSVNVGFLQQCPSRESETSGI
ncbi:histone H4-like isoform X2 [Branchiostoma floridae x Branchiostoma japonicum]